MNCSHDSLDIDERAIHARGTARARRARAGSVRRQRARGGRSRPSGWTPGGSDWKKTYFEFEGEERIECPTGPAMEADAQHAVQGPQWLLLPSSPCVATLSLACV